MCGLYGVIGQGIQRDDLIIFKDLMIMNAIRGHHSTGVALGRSSQYGAGKTSKARDKVTIIKKAFDPIWFLENLEKDEETDLADTFNDYFLGHDRWATTGKIDAAAAHPFEHGNIVGTHNGTFESLKIEGFNSDSDAFFHRANELGIKAAVMTLTNRDKYALVWYDKSTGRVNFLRNNHKKFWFCYHPSRNVMYYSSELGSLKWALERRGVTPDEYWYPREDIMYSIDPQNLKRRNKILFGTQEVKALSFTHMQQQQTQLPPFDPTMVGPSCDV
jgi:predicted glutamine amidotransferase